MYALCTRVVPLVKTLLELNGKEDADVSITQFNLTLLCHHQVVFSLNSYSSPCLPIQGSSSSPWSKSLYGTECQEFWILTLVLRCCSMTCQVQSLPFSFLGKKEILLTPPPLARALKINDVKITAFQVCWVCKNQINNANPHSPRRGCTRLHAGMHSTFVAA